MNTPRQMHRNARGQRGFSLVELMIAMILGLVIIGGAISVFLASKRSLTEGEQTAAIAENGRFALQILGFSARHIRFMGGATPEDIRQDGSLGAVTDDCTDQAAAYAIDTPLFAMRVDEDDLPVLGCVDDAADDTDLLVIKGVEPNPLYDSNPSDPNDVPDGVISWPSDPTEAWSSEKTYIIANSESGILLDGADTPPSVAEGQEFALGVAWPYQFAIYYVRDRDGDGENLSLSRKVLNWDSGNMAIETEDLVEGVENLRFLFGYDSDGDGNPDSIADAEGVETDGMWGTVTSMQTFILLRSDVADPNYDDEKSYQLGDETFTPDDNVRRVLLTSETTLRNPRLLLRGGG